MYSTIHRLSTKAIFLLISISLLFNLEIHAQAPQSINYQGVARDNSGNVLSTQSVSLRLSILSSSATGTAVYVETHSPTTDAFGLFSIKIGQGTPVSGTFNTISWGSDVYYLKVEIDPAGGATYQLVSTNQFVSVPYALYAKESGTSNSWSRTGNSATVDGTHFIGTTDNIPFSFKVNNQKAGKIDQLNRNVFLGYQSANVLTSTDNVGIGYRSLYQNTSGFGSVAVGSQSMLSNTTGNCNTALGSNAMYANTSGTTNTALGYQVLYSNTSGNDNTAGGYRSILYNTTGAGNTAFGSNAMKYNATGSSNASLGAGSLQNNVAGSNGVAVGFNSQLNANSTATAFDNTNTSVGYQSLKGSATPTANTGLANTAIGRDALSSNASGSNNTASGYNSMFANTSGNYNSALGSGALSSNTSGNVNTAMGYMSLNVNTTGNQNTAMGNASLSSNTTGEANTAMGTQSLQNNTIGTENTAHGRVSLALNTTGNFNTATGSVSLFHNTTGSNNTTMGYGVLYTNTTGSNNTALGVSAGQNNNGSSNVFIGYQAGWNELGSNKLYIANSSSNPPLIYGDFSSLRIGIGTITPATSLDVNGIITATGGNSSNWNMAYGWGNHAGLYRPIGWVPSWTDITNKPTFAPVASSGSYNDLTNKPTLDGSETKVMAGNNIYINGSGTTSNPYIINSSASGGSSNCFTHHIGELFQGGIIVHLWFDDANVEHGLIASIENLMNGNSTWTQWSNVSSDGTAWSLVDGQSNSASIIAMPGHEFSAAALCANYSHDGYSDWYLPSFFELYQIYTSFFTVTTIREYYMLMWVDGGYWSSTESYTGQAMYIDMMTGGLLLSASKSLMKGVRAFRRF